MAEVDLEPTGIVVRHQAVAIAPWPVIDRVDHRRGVSRKGADSPRAPGWVVSGWGVAVGGRVGVSAATAAIVAGPASAQPKTRATPGRRTADGAGPGYEPDASSASI